MGFVRDVLIAAALGAGPVADAFVVAFRLPTVARRLFAEGAVSAAFVPLYIRAKADGEERNFADQTFTAAAVILGAGTIAVILLMPWVLRLIAPGLSEESQARQLTVSLARIAFPYCLTVALTALAAAVLHAKGLVSAAAYFPPILNAVLIAAVGLANAAGWGSPEATAHALAYAIVIGGAVQLLAAGLALRCAGAPIWFSKSLSSPSLKRFLKIALPGLAAACITQVNALVALIIGSSEPGVITWLHYADRIYQLPLGIVGVAIGIALLPDLSHHLALGNREGERHALSRAAEFATFLVVPATFGLMFAATPIVAALFERGAFGAADTRATAMALSAFAIGLPAFVAAKVMQPLFFARMQMRLPLVIAAAGAVCDVVLAVLLFPDFKQAGIAAAAAASGWVNALGLGVVAWKRGLLRLDAPACRRLPRLAAAGVVMAGITVVVAPLVTDWVEGMGDAARFAGVALAATAFFSGYAGLSMLFGGIDRQALRGAFSKPGSAYETPVR